MRAREGCVSVRTTGVVALTGWQCLQPEAPTPADAPGRQGVRKGNAAGTHVARATPTRVVADRLTCASAYPSSREVQGAGGAGAALPRGGGVGGAAGRGGSHGDARRLGADGGQRRWRAGEALRLRLRDGGAQGRRQRAGARVGGRGAAPMRTPMPMLRERTTQKSVCASTHFVREVCNGSR